MPTPSRPSLVCQEIAAIYLSTVDGHSLREQIFYHKRDNVLLFPKFRKRLPIVEK